MGVPGQWTGICRSKTWSGQRKIFMRGRTATKSKGVVWQWVPTLKRPSLCPPPTHPGTVDLLPSLDK